MGGRFTARFVVGRPVRNTVLCALGVGACVTLYALATGRSPAEAALSGEATLSGLARDPHAWSVGALVAVLAFKGLAYALSLGSLRGGPVFPALFLGGPPVSCLHRCLVSGWCRPRRSGWRLP